MLPPPNELSMSELENKSLKIFFTLFLIRIRVFKKVEKVRNDYRRTTKSHSIIKESKRIVMFYLMSCRKLVKDSFRFFSGNDFVASLLPRPVVAEESTFIGLGFARADVFV